MAATNPRNQALLRLALVSDLPGAADRTSAPPTSFGGRLAEVIPFPGSRRAQAHPPRPVPAAKVVFRWG